MRRVFFCLGLLLVAVTFMGCGGKQDDDDRISNRKNFPKSEKIEVKKVHVNEVIKPISMKCTDNFLLVQGDYSPQNNTLYVYDANTLEFRYDFLKMGTGPQEVLFPMMFGNNKGDELRVLDAPARRIMNFRITADSAVCQSVQKINHDIETAGMIQEIYTVNDSVVLFNTMGPDGNFIYTYNMNADAPIDKFAFETNLKGNIDERYVPIFERFSLGYANGNVYVGFHCSNTLVKGHLDEHYKIVMDEQKVTVPVTSYEKTMDQVSYYSKLITTSNYVIGEYYGYPVKEAMAPEVNDTGRRHLDYQLEVYTPDLKPLKLLDPSGDIMNIALDVKRNRFYTWNVLEDFDNILVYDLPELK